LPQRRIPVLVEKIPLRNFLFHIEDRGAVSQHWLRVAADALHHLIQGEHRLGTTGQLLIAGKLGEVERNAKLYPDETDTAAILKLDQSGESANVDPGEIEKAYQVMKDALTASGMGKFAPDYETFKSEKEYSLPVKSKNNTFHYLPYNFGGSGSSGFEIDTFKLVLRLSGFIGKGLEIYYNGERGLTEFVIDCFEKAGKNWKPTGKYTTDFLVIKRTENNKIHKALLVETKGALYANDPRFQKKKNYVETEFLKLNTDKFGYQKFDFLYLEDSKNSSVNITQFNNKINLFFN